MLDGKQTLAMGLLTRISDCTPYKAPGEHGDWAPREQILDANQGKLWATCMAWEFSFHKIVRDDIKPKDLWRDPGVCPEP